MTVGAASAKGGKPSTSRISGWPLRAGLAGAATLFSATILALWGLPFERPDTGLWLQVAYGLVALCGAGLLLGVVLFLRREERRRLDGLAESTLRFSEDRYRLLAVNAHDVIWTFDLAKRRYSYVSPSITTLRGLTVEEALVEPLEQSLTPESLARMQAAMALIGTPLEGSPSTDLYDQPCRDGTIKHVEITTSVVRDPAGRPLEVLGVSRDATARVVAERVLEERERHLQAILETAQDGFWVVGEQGRLLEANRAACTMLGYTREELLQLRISDLEANQSEAGTASHIERVDELGWARFESRLRRKDGRLIDVEIAAKTSGTSPVVQVVSVRDITEARRGQEALRLSQEQFWQAQKLESVGRLAGGVAHDFNNLLTVILSGVEELRHAGEPDSVPIQEMVEEIGTAAERARDLTRQLLTFARKQMVAPTAVDLGDVVRKTEKLLRRLLGEDVELVSSLAPDLWPVRCDLGLAEQVLLNLAVNARDAMPGGGRLHIETANVLLDHDDVVSCPGMSPGPHVRLVVSDSGMGMDAEVKAHLFEPFFTTKGVGQGTGLGLSTVYGIIAQSGGFIAVASEPGRGTVFTIHFPRTSGQASHAVPPLLPRISPGTETVLVVEDEAPVRAVTVRALAAAGYKVLVAGAGREALALAAREAGPIHLLVTDVVMPGMGGPDMASALGRLRPGLRVLFVSGYTRDSLDLRGELPPGFELLPKPFTPAVLLERVRAVLDGAAHPA